MGTRGALRWKRSGKWLYFYIHNDGRYHLEAVQKRLATCKTRDDVGAALDEMLEEENTPFESDWDGKGFFSMEYSLDVNTSRNPENDHLSWDEWTVSQIYQSVKGGDREPVPFAWGKWPTKRCKPKPEAQELPPTKRAKRSLSQSGVEIKKKN